MMYMMHFTINRNFNSLPHTEVDNEYKRMLPKKLYFNSLPHTEVDRSLRLMHPFPEHFNSLPHTEVDKYFRAAFPPVFLFQLTTSHRGRLD